MLDPESILRLYANVLHNDIVVNAVSTQEIRKSVQSMAHVYSAENNSTFDSSVLKFLNFNDTACRCAYLHKYAPLHTYIAFDAMLKIFRTQLTIFRNLVTGNREFRLCSLGGGPGSDVLGVISALRVVFNALRASISVVDCMEKWESTFSAVLQELKFGGYGPDWYHFASDLKWNYIGANLLCKMTDEVNAAIGSASLITMMKFISASVCTDTEEMVNKIFRVMKVGALVLYIDNAGGGFTELIERSSQRNGLVPVVGPLKHVQYDAEALKVERFGYSSCYQTKVTIILLQKVQKPNLNLNREIRSNPTHRLQSEPEPRKKLDFVVYEVQYDSNSQTPLDVNVFNEKLNNTSGADSKCVEKYPEKLMNNLRNPPPKFSNAARTFHDFPRTSAAMPPPKSSHATPRKSNPTSSQTPNRVSPRKSNPRSSQTPNRVSPRESNPTFSQTPNLVSPRESQPVYRTPAAAQRYQPVPPAEYYAPPQELDDDSDDAGCSCCVIS